MYCNIYEQPLDFNGHFLQGAKMNIFSNGKGWLKECFECQNTQKQIWVVEFYAHWCGHCQKFAKIWKKIAEEFYGKKNSGYII